MKSKSKSIETKITNHKITDNDNLVTVKELAQQINAYHAKAEESEAEALRNAWEAGVRLNKAFEIVTYGDWGKYIEKNCSGLGLTTVWRYRRLADSYSTVEELAGETLTETYTKLGLVKLQEECVPTEESESSDSEKKEQKSDTSKKPMNPLAKVIKDVAKASLKFDAPASMSLQDKTAVKKLCIKLEDIHGQTKGPSIIGVNWQAKLDQAVTDWTEEERNLFELEFNKLKAIHEKVEAIHKDKQIC